MNKWVIKQTEKYGRSYVSLDDEDYCGDLSEAKLFDSEEDARDSIEDRGEEMTVEVETTTILVGLREA